MIGVSKLLIDKTEPSDRLRYGHGGKLGGTPSGRMRPIVVYNCVKRCNLRCIHCYAHSTHEEAPDILSTEEAKALIDSCADFGSPVMLFSGGEPLLRKDLMDLMHPRHDPGDPHHPVHERHAHHAKTRPGDEGPEHGLRGGQPGRDGGHS